MILIKPQPPQIVLPKGWQSGGKSAVIHAISLAHYAIASARAWGTDRALLQNSPGTLLRERPRIIDERMLLVVAGCRGQHRDSVG